MRTIEKGAAALCLSEAREKKTKPSMSEERRTRDLCRRICYITYFSN